VRRRVEAAAGRRLEAYEHGELPYEDTQDLQLGGGEPQPAPSRSGVLQAAPLQPGQSLLPLARSALHMARAQQALTGLPSAPDQGTSPVLKRYCERTRETSLTFKCPLHGCLKIW